MNDDPPVTSIGYAATSWFGPQWVGRMIAGWLMWLCFPEKRVWHDIDGRPHGGDYQSNLRGRTRVNDDDWNLLLLYADWFEPASVESMARHDVLIARFERWMDEQGIPRS